ncbi:riboflavin synthase [Aureicoccus marinus]|uniref:Riboflavin synthase n=1 Tax=Aureicoccus marinus TaxID=754435 RepID=A0A2S7T9V5_9FLAO|nr:riboflavin synthase [Aureicoccus marinus]PQJ16297.1 riboflavin synthase subunit alpha [Aureicoccus marinus]
MFTGIIESLGKITGIDTEEGNRHIRLQSSMTSELKVDQSLAHNGVCLTVVAIEGDEYVVTAVQETLIKTTIGEWQVGELVNLERAMQMGARLDGHIVQGHVDQTAECIQAEETDGSWHFRFQYEPKALEGGSPAVTIEKGSITVDGVSLTVVDSTENAFSVAIIPYTYEHTCFQQYQVGRKVNLEFDVIGKYVSRLLSLRD